MDDTLYHAPSNLAGGVGGSDYGDDLRFFGGHLHCTKSMSVNDQPSVLCRSRVMLHVFDAIDFCPGQCGTGAEQLLTIAFSRLEASGLAYDIPLYVEVWMPVIEVNTILWEMSAERVRASSLKSYACQRARRQSCRSDLVQLGGSRKSSTGYYQSPQRGKNILSSRNH